ncbi:Proton-coupled amino acid transporter 4 [Trichoplax sp. H2]|nr:Proton-coupled amino acid transporter 4 [Trichoplax sp. H2]|eukprot:RDD45877.1 Proton-coupled amino acid transporter 4 [Trichoplax sp. H2]
MNDDNKLGKPLLNPVDNVGYGSEINSEECEELLPEDERTDTVHEGKLLRDWEGFMTLVKVNLGTGILGLPFAMKNSGLLFGPILLLFMAVLSTHCMHMLVTSSQIISKNVKAPSVDYGKTAEFSIIKIFPKKSFYARKFVNCVIWMMQYGFCATYILFMAENLKQLVGHFDVKIWMLLLVPPLIVFSYIRSLDILSYMSFFANICLVTGLIIIYQYIFQGIHHIEKLPLIASLDAIPLSFGSIIFAFEGICAVLPLENRMKKPKNFSKVLWAAQTFITICYMLMAVGGYLRYGSYSLGSITLNLPKTPMAFNSYFGVMFVYRLRSFSIIILNILTLFPVSFAIVFIIHFNSQDKLSNKSNLVLTHLSRNALAEAGEIKKGSIDLAYRTIMVIVTAALAIAVPKLGLFISLIGAFLGSMACLVFPALIEIGTHYSYCPPVSKWMILKDIIIIILGCLCGITGTSVTIYRLVLAFNGHTIHHNSLANVTLNLF